MAIGEFLVCIALCTTCIPGCWAIYKTACLEGGQAAGEVLYNRGQLSNVDSDTLHLMKDTGAINCYGVIKEWKFFRVGSCENANFYVWRLMSDDDYRLVGRNYYDKDANGCGSTEIETFRVPGNKQIPVSPGDIMGWSQDIIGAMISTANDSTTLTLTTAAGNPPPDLDDSRSFSDSTLMEISLQAIVTRSTLPLFSTLPREQSLPEGSSTATKLVYTVKAVHPGNIMPQLDEASAMDKAVNVTYQVMGHTDKFYIDIKDGEVRTISDFHYEAGSVYEVPIAASAMAMTATSTLTIRVTEAVRKLTISGPSDKVFSISALDKRTDDEIFRVFLQTYTGNKEVRYYLDHSKVQNNDDTVNTPPFYIDENTGIVRCSMDLTRFVYDPSLSPYEDNVTLPLTVIATDGVLFDHQDVDVTISHLRQIPAFANLPHSVHVNEAVAAMTRVFKSEVKSTYPTESVHFKMLSVEPNEFHDNFEIDSQSGVIWIRDHGGLLREEDYTLTLSVRDSVNATAEGELTIHVDTVNQPPYYKPQFYKAVVPEKCDQVDVGCSTSLPWEVIGINLTSFDRESNVICSATDESWPEYAYTAFNFSGPCENQILQVIETVDVDLHPWMQLINLTTTIMDDEGLEAIAYIQLTFYDINDHVPQFTIPEYTCELDENTPGGLSLFEVIAEDGDLTAPNNEVRYSIEGGLGHMYFKIDPVSGIVSTKQAVDYEDCESKVIVFIVKAKDLGEPPKENNTTVSIAINDLNDMHPRFECLNRAGDDPYPHDQDCFYNLELRSDTAIGHELVQLVATDIDTVTPDVFFFLLKPNSRFVIHDRNGSVESTQKLSDYTKYILYCYAEDRGSPNLFSQIQYVRVDAFPAPKHLIDITLDMNIDQFNVTQVNFMNMLREMLIPWHAKLENFKLYKEKTKVTIYALTDDSTYDIRNMRSKKKFVHRDSLLGKLRKNIQGTPSNELIDKGHEFYPIRVMPTFPIWWTDTMEGIATISALCFLFVILCVTVALLICWKKGALCFGQKPVEDKPVMEKVVTKPPPTPYSDEYQMKLHYGDGAQTLRLRSAVSSHDDVDDMVEESKNVTDEEEKSEETKEPSLSRKASLTSIASVDTIHTVVFDRGQTPRKT